MMATLDESANAPSRPHSLIAQFAGLPIPNPCRYAKRAMWRVLERTMSVHQFPNVVHCQTADAPMWCMIVRRNMARFLLADMAPHHVSKYSHTNMTVSTY